MSLTFCLVTVGQACRDAARSLLTRSAITFVAAANTSIAKRRLRQSNGGVHVRFRGSTSQKRNVGSRPIVLKNSLCAGPQTEPLIHCGLAAGAKSMMGERQTDHPALFYEFSLERHVPGDHLLRSIDRFVDLGDIREQYMAVTSIQKCEGLDEAARGMGVRVKEGARGPKDRMEGQKSGAAKTREKNLQACSLACTRATLPPLVHRNARASKELADDRPPALAPPRDVAQAVASGMSAAKSYAMAYCRSPNGATRASAARLLTDVNMRHRIIELRREAAEQATSSLQALIPALDERARAAMSTGRMREAVEVLKRLAEIAAGVPHRA